MPVTYPPAGPTLSGDVETINRFLQSPTAISRRLRTLAENRFISDALLTGRYPTAGGAVLYEQSESIYTDRAVESVSAGSEYPLTTVSTGTAQIAAVVKWGQDALVTDEAVKRLLMDPVNRALTKLVNQMVRSVDSVSLSAIASGVSQTVTALGAWSSSAQMLRDLLRAKALIIGLNQGYDPNIAVVTDMQYAYIMSDPTVTNALMRENAANPIYTGAFPRIAGLTILPTVAANLPSGNPMVLDSSLLGGMADEQLGGPGYSGAVQGVESKTIREDVSDRWRLRARRITVPVIVEPNAAIAITGTGTFV